MADAFLDQTLDINFKGDITVAGTLTVTGAQTFTGNQSITGNLTVGTGVTITAGGLNITAGALNHDGTTVGLYGKAPVTQAAVPTAMHAAVTQAGTDSGDTAIQAAVDSGAASSFGFANAAEFEAIVAMVRNNNAVLTEIRTALIGIGVHAAA